MTTYDHAEIVRQATEIERLSAALNTICGICLARDEKGQGQARIHAIAIAALAVAQKGV